MGCYTKRKINNMLQQIQSRKQKVLLLDGGVSSEIAKIHQYSYIDKDPLWSCRLLSDGQETRETIKRVHRSFLEAGSDIIGTVTYQSSVNGFQKHFNVTALEAKELIKTGVRLAIEARDQFWNENRGKCVQQKKPLVSASLGPYAVYLADASEYTGNYMEKVTEEELRAFHKVRMETVLEAGADLIAFETVPAKQEALLIAQLMKDLPGALAWICFSCQDGERVSHGETLRECTDSLLEYEQIIGVGVNCTPPQHIHPLLQKLSPEVKSKKTIVIYPNSGEYWNSEKRWVCTEKNPSLAELLPSWLDVGAQWIGGCCKVTPEHIGQIHSLLASSNCFS